MEQFPDYEMPEREIAPFDRDHLLPQATYPPMDMEWGDEDGFEEDDLELGDEDGALK